MDYGAVVLRAWQVTWKYRFLWLLGLLAMFTEGGGGSFGGGNFNLPNFPSSEERKQDESYSALPLLGLSEAWPRLGAPILGDQITREKILERLEALLKRAEENWPVFVLAGFLLLVFLLALTYISLAAKAGLILSVEALETQRLALGFGDAWNAGVAYAWRLWGLLLLIGLLILLALGIVFTPLILGGVLAATREAPEAMVGPVFLTIALVVLFIPVLFYFTLLEKLGSRRIVLAREGITAALSGAHEIIKRKLGPTLITMLINVGLGLAYSLVLALPLVLVGAVLVAVGVGVYAAAHLAGVIVYGVIAGGLLLAALFLANAIFTAFISTYWTLSYRALEYLARTLPPKPEVGEKAA